MKYTLGLIKKIGELAFELRKDLSDQPLEIRRKISSIANLAAVVEANVWSTQLEEKKSS